MTCSIRSGTSRAGTFVIKEPTQQTTRFCTGRGREITRRMRPRSAVLSAHRSAIPSTEPHTAPNATLEDPAGRAAIPVCAAGPGQGQLLFDQPGERHKHEVAGFEKGTPRVTTPGHSTCLKRAKFSRRSAALATLSAGSVVWVATSRARATYSGSRIRRRSETSDFSVVIEKRRPEPTFKSFDPSCRDRRIGPRPKDQHGDSGAQACGHGAHATVVHDRAAGRKGNRVVHRTHHLDVVQMGDMAEVTPAGAHQRPLAQLRAGRADHGERVGGRFDRRAAKPEENRIGGVPAAIHDATSLSASVGQLHRQRADKGPLAIPFRPFGCQPREANLVVGLNFQ